MTIKNYINRYKELTLKELIIKVNKKVFEKIDNKIKRRKCINNDIRFIDNKFKILYKYIDLCNIKIEKPVIENLFYLTDKYLKHEFDLLGSGWINVNYNSKSSGVEGNLYTSNINIKSFKKDGKWIEDIIPKVYSEFSKQTWSHISEGYKPIDWQKDFKSGYRYNSKEWYKDQPIGKHAGVDIKVPWELCRMQHIPQMAIVAKELEEYRKEFILEFKNEVLDFIATNPPNLGCDWTCTMDVAIRISNILLAYDILSNLDDEDILDEKFKSILDNSTYEHGQFIINNLEWNGEKSGNHYLSDICGLLFVASYLNRTEEVDAWLVFAIQEIIECCKNQFYEDGSNFEASTSYHKLSGELMIYSTALIYGILKQDKKEALKNYNYNLVKRLKKPEEQEYNIESNEFFPSWYLERLFKSGCFTLDITKCNNRIPQIGDNDSGKFFKFSPVGEFITCSKAYTKYYNLKNNKDLKNSNEDYWDEDILNHSTFISAIGGLFNYKEFEKYCDLYPIESSIVRALSKGKVFNMYKIYYKPILISKVDTTKLKNEKISIIDYEYYGLNKINLDKVKLIPYPDFGIYIFKSEEFYLSIMAGKNGQNGNGGHAHNDKLSFELNIQGKDIFVDPGTYLYTPIPKKRNEFRGVNAHNVPIVNNEEQNTFLHAFSMKNETKCLVMDYSDSSLKIYLEYRDIRITREFKICSSRLIIEDRCNKEFRVNFNKGEIYSNGYGKLTSLK